MEGTPQEPIARMDVPPEGAACGVVFLVLFVGFFVALAVYHIANFSETHIVGVVAAVLWLAFVILASWAAIHSAGGMRVSAIATLGEFSSRPFVEVSRDGDRTVIAFGYELFRRRFYYLRVERERIVSVEMNTGQATALAGRDMNDWSVILWYRDPTCTPPRKHVEGVRDDEVHIVGPAQAKAITAEFFAAFVAFLRAAGVELHSTAKGNEFRAVRQGADPITPRAPGSEA